MNEVVLAKSESIQRCIQRARQELEAARDNFANDFTRQDAAILNITRACEQSIDLSNHIVRKRKLGLPKSAGNTFELLARSGLIPTELAGRLKGMVGFRIIAVHEYQDINIEILISIIAKGSDDLLRFTEIALSAL